jgi:hypothetical protein
MGEVGLAMERTGAAHAVVVRRVEWSAEVEAKQACQQAPEAAWKVEAPVVVGPMAVGARGSASVEAVAPAEVAAAEEAAGVVAREATVVAAEEGPACRPGRAVASRGSGEMKEAQRAGGTWVVAARAAEVRVAVGTEAAASEADGMAAVGAAVEVEVVVAEGQVVVVALGACLLGLQEAALVVAEAGVEACAEVERGRVSWAAAAAEGAASGAKASEVTASVGVASEGGSREARAAEVVAPGACMTAE